MKGCHGHKFTDFINFSFHLTFAGGYWNIERDIVVIPLQDLKNSRRTPLQLSKILAHEFGHRFCYQEFPEKINKRARYWGSKAYDKQEKMMCLFAGEKTKF